MPAPSDPCMGEPGSDDKRCVVTGIGQWIDDVWVHKWGNTACDKTHFYLCQNTIGNSWTYNGYKYTYNDEKKKWNKANKDCKSNGGHLLSIRSDDELEAILPHIPLNSKGRHRNIHIGLKKKNGDWEWVDSDDKYSESEAEDLEWATG